MSNQDLHFVWDEDKNQLNIKKHHIDFKIAALVFNDLNRIELYDDAHSSLFEHRYKVIGRINDIVLLVIYTVKFESIRIISARKSTKEEESIYYAD